MRCNFRKQKLILSITLILIIVFEILEAIVVPLFYLFVYEKEFHIVAQSCAIHFFVLTIYSLEFIYACLAVKERFSLLQKYLNEIESKKYADFKRIQILEKLYHKLCDLIEIINNSLSFNLIPTTFIFTISNMFGAYSFIWAFIRDDSKFVEAFIQDFLWILMQHMILMAIAYAGHNTTAEAGKIKTKISRIIIKFEHNSKERNMLESCLNVIQYRNLNLQCSLFSFNWNFFLAVTSFTITYLIICTQYELLHP